MSSGVGDNTLSALGHYDERRSGFTPRGKNLVLTVTWIQPLDVLITGFHDVRQGDEFLNTFPDIIRAPHDGGSDVRVVADACPSRSLLGHNLNHAGTPRLEGGTNGADVHVGERLTWNHGRCHIPEQIKHVRGRPIIGNGGAGAGGAIKTAHVIYQNHTAVVCVLGDGPASGVRAHPGGEDHVVTEATDTNRNVQRTATRCL